MALSIFRLARVLRANVCALRRKKRQRIAVCIDLGSFVELLRPFFQRTALPLLKAGPLNRLHGWCDQE